MIQSINFSPIRNTVPINFKSLPAPQMDSGSDFRDVMDKSTIYMQSIAIAGGVFYPPNGGSISVLAFKPDDFSPDNPVIQVKGTDINGKEFNVEININNVDPKNASLIEMVALDGYLNATGQPSGITRQLMISNIMRSSSNEMDANTKFDFIAILDEIMDAQRFHGNLNGFLKNKDLMEFLSSFPK